MAHFVADANGAVWVNNGLAAAQLGSGNAHYKGTTDKGQVVQVEWCTAPLPGLAGSVGGHHSIVHVRVSSRGRNADYALEKSRVGVLISKWSEIVKHTRCLQCIHRLHRSQINHRIRIADLYKIAASTGEYDVGSSNCHHAALEIYNACAYEYKDTVWKIPDFTLTKVARLLKFVGADVSNFQSHSCESASQSVPGSEAQFRSESGSHFYDPWHFRMDPNRGTKHHEMVAAQLSSWIYQSGSDTICPLGPPNRCFMYPVTQQNPVQWACVETQEHVYIVFKGTDNVFDGIVDANIMPDDCHGLQVHGGMWMALRQQDCHVLQTAKKHVRDFKDKTIVLCGHSLGGGYAILVALELLSFELPVNSVVTFGAPQVVIPKPLDKNWKRLNQVTVLYVNSWDIVPRLPSCESWVDLLPSVTCNSFGPLKLRPNVNVPQLKQLGRNYDVVGTLMFIRADSSLGMSVPFDTETRHRGVLSIIPEQSNLQFDFPAATSCHAMKQYLEIIQDMQCY